MTMIQVRHLFVLLIIASCLVLCLWEYFQTPEYMYSVTGMKDEAQKQKLPNSFSSAQRSIKAEIMIDNTGPPPTNHSTDKDSAETHISIVQYLQEKYIFDNGVIRPNCMTSRFLVYTCGSGLCGGLGDRMKGIISTFLLALASNRTFAIVHTRPCPLTQSLIPSTYDWNHCTDYILQLPSEDKETHSYFSSGLNVLNDIKDFGLLFKKRVVFLKTNLIVFISWMKKNGMVLNLLPLLNNLNIDVLCSQILQLLFKPTERMETDISSIFEESRGDKELVCSHIRLGKNPTLPNDNFMRHGTPNVSGIFRFLDNYRDNPNYVLFTATDADSVRNQVAERYKNSVSTERRIVHIDRFKKDGGECDGLFTAVLEQQILSCCDELILTRSNFGVMAAYIRASSDSLYCYMIKANSVVPCRYDELNSLYGFV